jgi:type I restriction enzyme S subunit
VHDGLAFISEQQAEQLQNVEVQEGDVLLNITGDSVARACQVDKTVLPARVNQHVAIIRPNPQKIDAQFLRYFLVTPEMQAYMLAMASAGATRNALTKGMIENFRVPAKRLDEQRAIASTFGALENKLELNRRMNETLEHMARAIFKDWFVDFGPTRAKMKGWEPYLEADLWSLFPERLGEEGKPEGWKYERLDALFNISIGRTPPRKEKQHFVRGGQGRTWLSIKTMGELQVFAFESEEDLTPEAVAQFRVPLIPAGTVMVSFKLTVGRVAIAAHDMHSNEAIAHLLRRQDTEVSNEYAYCFMKAFDYSSLGSTSSIATAVNSQSIKGIEMLVPDAQIHRAFTETLTLRKP